MEETMLSSPVVSEIVTFSPQGLMEHSYLGLVGGTFLILIGLLIAGWTLLRIKFPNLNLPDSLAAPRLQQGVTELREFWWKVNLLRQDPQFTQLSPTGQLRLLIILLEDFLAQHYRTLLGCPTVDYRHHLATDLPEMSWLLTQMKNTRFPTYPLETLVNYLGPILRQMDNNLTRGLPVPRPVYRWKKLWLITAPLVLILGGIGTWQDINWFHSQQITRAIHANQLEQAKKHYAGQESRIFVSEKWVDQYNLGTSGLKLGDLDQANHYLGQAVDSLRLNSMFSISEPGSYFAMCQTYYNFAQTSYQRIEKLLAQGKTSSEVYQIFQQDQTADRLGYLFTCTSSGWATWKTIWEQQGIDYREFPQLTQLTKLIRELDVLSQALFPFLNLTDFELGEY